MSNHEEKTNNDSDMKGRASWGGKMEFIMTSIAYAVGLGNVWRFPYLCFNNGGGAFLIPILIMVIIVGLPLFFFELAFGQFASLGPIAIWDICPLFKGIGYSMVIISWAISIYYIVIISHCLFFFISSFASILPWATCGNFWNTKDCIDCDLILEYFSKSWNLEENQCCRNYILQLSTNIMDFGYPNWRLSLCLLLSWAIVCVALIRGISSLGKVAYFTALFPYVVLTAMLVHSLTMKGSLQGLYYYIYPNFSKLLEVKVWIEAATQVLFSLSVCNGGLIAMSSFNKFKNNCYSDVVIITIINLATCLFAGAVIFANLGVMAHDKNVTVGEVAKGGPGLVFIVYPESLMRLPGAPIWSAVFFLMMLTLGYGSQFSIVECVLSGILDELRKLKFHMTKRREILFRISICLINFLFGLPLICNGGSYLLSLVDHIIFGFPMLLIGLGELCVVSYCYGIRQFCKDVALMIDKEPNLYWKATWLVITPISILVLLGFSFQRGFCRLPNGELYPIGFQIFEVLFAIGVVASIPVWFLYKYCKEGGLIVLMEFMKPINTWGPADDLYRLEFLKRLVPMIIRDGLILDENLSVEICPSNEVDDSVIEVAKNSFYQSKLSIAEKMTQAHIINK